MRGSLIRTTTPLLVLLFITVNLTVAENTRKGTFDDAGSESAVLMRLKGMYELLHAHPGLLFSGIVRIVLATVLSVGEPCQVDCDQRRPSLTTSITAGEPRRLPQARGHSVSRCNCCWGRGRPALLLSRAGHHADHQLGVIPPL